MRKFKMLMLLLVTAYSGIAFGQSEITLKVECGSGFAAKVNVQYVLYNRPYSYDYTITACISKKVSIPVDARSITYNAICALCSGCGFLSASPCDGVFDNGSSSGSLSPYSNYVISMSGTIFSNNIQLVSQARNPSAVSQTPSATIQPKQTVTPAPVMATTPAPVSTPPPPPENTTPIYDRVSKTNNMTPLQEAIFANNYSKAETMVQKGANVNTVDSNNFRTAMHYAALADDKDMIQMLKDKGSADINYKDKNGKTPLDLALEGSKFNAAKALLSNNADARLATAGLERVLATKNTEILKLMLQNGADANLVIKKSIASDNVETMKFVFENASARASNALFEEAINLRSTKCAIGLLQNGIDKNKAMDFVIGKKDKTMVDLVLSTGVDVTGATKAMVFGVEQRDLAMVENTVKNYYANASEGMPAAVNTSNVQMVNLLLDNHADPNDQLDEAAAGGKNDIVSAFLMKGGFADNGVKAAAENLRISTLKLLLENNGDANLAMPIAIAKNNTSMVQMCLTATKPADVFRSEYVVTACQNSNFDILNALLMAGAPPDPGMIVSIGKGDIKLVDLLIKAKASVDRPDYMTTAANVGNSSVVKLLLDAGADPNPGLPIAAGKGNGEVVDLMLAKGALAQPGLLPAVIAGSQSVAGKLIAKGARAETPEVILASVPHNNKALTLLLIENGADPKVAVGPSIKDNKSNVLSALIEKGADAKNPDFVKMALTKNYVETARVLFDAGGNDPKWSDPRNSNYIDLAASLGLPDIINLLAGYKVDANQKDADGNTAIINAATNKEQYIKQSGGDLLKTVLTALLNAGSDPNMLNSNTEAPLHLLCKGGMKNQLREDCIEILLGKGANACLKDNKGNFPRENLPGMEGGPRGKLKRAMKDGDCK